MAAEAVLSQCRNCRLEVFVMLRRAMVRRRVDKLAGLAASPPGSSLMVNPRSPPRKYWILEQSANPSCPRQRREPFEGVNGSRSPGPNRSPPQRLLWWESIISLKRRPMTVSRLGDHAITNSTHAFLPFTGQNTRSRVRNCCSFNGRIAIPTPAWTINTTLDQTEEMLAMRGENPASEHSSMTLSNTVGEVSRDESTKGSLDKSRRSIGPGAAG